MDKLPVDIYVSEIFPKIKLSEILELASLQPYLIEGTNNYLVEMGKSLGMENLKDYKDFLHRLTLKHGFARFMDDFLSDLYYFLIENHEFSLEWFFDKYEPKIKKAKLEFMEDLENSTFTRSHIRFAYPEWYQNFSDSFVLFKKAIKDVKLDFYFDFLYDPNYADRRDDDSDNYYFAEENFTRILNENLNRML